MTARIVIARDIWRDRGSLINPSLPGGASCWWSWCRCGRFGRCGWWAVGVIVVGAGVVGAGVVGAGAVGAGVGI